VGRSFGRNSEGNGSIGELTVTERSVLKVQHPDAKKAPKKQQGFIRSHLIN